MTYAHDEHTGTRIAAFRKLRDLTQLGLAIHAGVSYSLLTKVESGHKPASPQLLARCAKALAVSVPDLEGRPYIADLQRDRIDELIEPIRAALENWDIALDWGLEPRPLAEIHRDVARASGFRRDAEYVLMARELPALIDELVHLSHNTVGEENRRVHELLVGAYRCVHTLAYKVGMIDLGTVALDRMGWSAARAEDHCLEVLHMYLRAQQTFASGRLEVGLRVVEAAQRDLAGADVPASTSRTALTGALHLQGAILAARLGDHGQADERLSAAGAVAAASGELPDYGLSFGPTNVAAHQVSALLDRDRPVDAIAWGDTVDLPADWSRSRVGHLHIDLARANLLAGKPERALERLNLARQVAPQQARYHPSVRATVSALARQRRSTMGTLANYASWIGI